jgi:hypothetical protein
MDKEHVKGAADQAKGAIKDRRRQGRRQDGQGQGSCAQRGRRRQECGKARHRQIARVALRVSRPPSGGFFFDEVGGGRRAKSAASIALPR